MKFSITTWTVTAAAAAILALPVASAAQTPPATTPATTQPPATTAAQPAGDNAAAAEHLRQAKAALNDVPTANLSATAKTQVAELKKRLATLERASGANDNASATGAANRNAKATSPRGNANWGTEVAAMDKVLTALLGTGAPATGTGTTGTSGAAAAKGKAAATVTLDETSRTKLTEVRTHLSAYAAAMAGQPRKDEAATADAAATTTTAQPTDPQTAATTTAAQPPTAQAATAQPATGSTAPATQEAARRHLTEARNSLSGLTQLPAAAQLTGDARTQVSQLISNFNELITTQAEWRATYAKVAANMTALLGPEGAAAPAPSSTPGAVGTSGSGVTLDPALREKLVEMRKHLSEFERVAGGGASTSSMPEQAATAASGSTTSTTSATGTTGTAATGVTGGAAATTTTSGAPTTAPSATAGAQNDPIRHLTAIEGMLKTQNDSGGLTLDKTQLDMLRTHIAELRKLIVK